MQAYISRQEKAFKSRAVANQVQRKTDREPMNPLTQLKLLSQGKFQTAGTAQLAEDGGVKQRVASPAPNRTGMPDRLKEGIEGLSGFDMSDVRVHYNSDKPSQLQAHAYAQGNQIYLGPRQERHLPHEAWHVVQQKQGRVRATQQLMGQLMGLGVNDDVGLEREADLMGVKSLALVDRQNKSKEEQGPTAANITNPVFQAMFAVEVETESWQNLNSPINRLRIGERPQTEFGNKQNRHVLAWNFLIKTIEIVILHKSPFQAVHDLYKHFKFYLDQNQGWEFNKTNGLIGQLSKLNMNNSLACLTSLIRTFLEEYNKRENVTYRSNDDRNSLEGTRVKEAGNRYKDKISGSSNLLTPKNFGIILGDMFDFDFKWSKILEGKEFDQDILYKKTLNYFFEAMKIAGPHQIFTTYSTNRDEMIRGMMKSYQKILVSNIKNSNYLEGFSDYNYNQIVKYIKKQLKEFCGDGYVEYQFKKFADKILEHQDLENKNHLFYKGLNHGYLNDDDSDQGGGGLFGKGGLFGGGSKFGGGGIFSFGK